MLQGVVHYVFNENEDRDSINTIAGEFEKLKFLDDKVYDDENEASNAIDRLGLDFYDQLAVKFKSYEDTEYTESITKLYNEVKRMKESIVHYKANSSIANDESHYVDCTECGSLINEYYLPDVGSNFNKCPVCTEDLSLYITKYNITIKEEEVEQLIIKLEDERELSFKGGKQTIKWLVKREHYNDML